MLFMEGNFLIILNILQAIYNTHTIISNILLYFSNAGFDSITDKTIGKKMITICISLLSQWKYTKSQ